jgi:Holliday junction resolvase
MSASQRRKGAEAERQLAKALADELGIEVMRNTDPRHVSKGDILAIPGYSIEVKRCETLRRKQWWGQAVEQGIRHQAEPIVFYRQSRKPWRALVSGYGGYVDVEWDTALDAIRDKLAMLYGVYGKEAA